MQAHVYLVLVQAGAQAITSSSYHRKIRCLTVARGFGATKESQKVLPIRWEQRLEAPNASAEVPLPNRYQSGSSESVAGSGHLQPVVYARHGRECGGASPL
jgi:hypothetical protein